ncbi:coiled-coil domain-containing glutamate-rich protein 1 [Kryptolebias marmoratus]|uniref:coiled-coil domain-containing glutamate-rich protein 1 n=1 Tax=Kryptolebias marmoratus TaxID=37003 RepID=UPI0007F86444|nr:coiled-coil domain-containing glutamate-rich protein 1 [Kryptolebias marmoratus]
MLSEIMCRRIFQQQRQQEEKEAGLRRKSCSGRLQGRKTGGGGWSRGRNPLQHHQRHHHHQYHRHQQRQGLTLRPVNVKGFRVRGMQAPKNTNQFLMHEKYQMQHLRSDSVGSDGSCSSDSDDLELTDMDSYLGVLENARGALLDSPNPHDSTAQLLVLRRDGQCLHQDGQFLHQDGPCLRRDGPFLQEDSMQYFPSEDDLLQSQNFMQRDFVEFCDFLSL